MSTMSLFAFFLFAFFLLSGRAVTPFSFHVTTAFISLVFSGAARCTAVIGFVTPSLRRAAHDKGIAVLPGTGSQCRALPGLARANRARVAGQAVGLLDRRAEESKPDLA